LPPRRDTAGLTAREYLQGLPGGFGGEFVDGRRLGVYFTDPARAPEALAILRYRYPVRVYQGRWTLVQLDEWSQYLGPRLQANLSVIGPDVAGNRVLVGVIDASAWRQVERRLAELHVPCHLVALHIQPYARAARRAG
jgi:hypothetical protein